MKGLIANKTKVKHNISSLYLFLDDDFYHIGDDDYFYEDGEDMFLMKDYGHIKLTKEAIKEVNKYDRIEINFSFGKRFKLIINNDLQRLNELNNRERT